jgi:hypothetical protein
LALRKTKRGRPRIAAKRKRTNVVSVRLEDDVLDALKAAAGANKRKLSHEMAVRLRHSRTDAPGDYDATQLGLAVARMAVQARRIYGKSWRDHYRVAASVAYGCLCLMRHPALTPPGSDTTTPQLESWISQLKENGLDKLAAMYLAPHELGLILAEKELPRLIEGQRPAGRLESEEVSLDELPGISAEKEPKL